MTTKNLTMDEASSSAIIVKNAILARSGIYVYSHDEMLRRGHTPEIKKDFYKEYRPASVLVAAKDKFKYAVLTKEHPLSITSDNIQQVIEGVVGGTIDVVVLENEEVALKGEIAFYTKDAVSYYNTGAKETSAQYVSRVSPVYDRDYDYILEEIQEVQGMALTRQGRGGAAVAVLDSLSSADHKSAEKKIQGDKVMSSVNSILSFLGIGKSPQDELSSLVMDSLNGYSGLSDSEKKARRDKVEALISPLADSPEKKILVGTVNDCFTYPKEVLEKSEAVGKGLTSLYKLCVSSDTAALQTTFDSIKGEDDEKKTKDAEEKEAEEKKTKDAEAEAKEKETKDAEAKAKEDEEKKKKESEGTKDSMDLEKMVEAITARVVDSMSTKIDEMVKKNLGIEAKEKEDTKDSILPSFSSEERDSSFLLNGMFNG
jgi:hypothetical protein